jgi:hypothetical protein
MAGFQMSINGRFWVSTEGMRGFVFARRLMEDNEGESSEVI